jgi:hypothetical protein
MIRLYQNGGPKDGANREEKREYVWQQERESPGRREATLDPLMHQLM